MKRIFTLLTALISIVSVSAQQYGNTSWVAAGLEPNEMTQPGAVTIRNTSESDYTQGVFIVNEDWYGHQNSTVNFITNEGEWIYRVFQKENEGHELGCTTQFGTIYGDKFYLVSKQQRDPGAKITGSRFAVSDAKTMKVIKEFEYIASKTVTGSNGQDSLISIADGRSYLPVDEHKGYIGTSNGIWMYDSNQMEIGGQIAGTGNPNAEGYGQLYYAQIGTMVRANDYVFAVHQQDGILVIDANTDKIVKVIKAPVDTEIVKDSQTGKDKEKDIQRGFGSIVQSKDGNLWISMAQNTLGMGGALDYMLKLDPYTFQIDTIRIPLKEQRIGVIPNSWYAWTADGFCASKQENKIYWNGQDERGSWFTGYDIFCYDIDNNTFSKVFDIVAYPGNWRLYGTGFRIHPVTDEIYAFFYHQFQDPTHMLVRINNKGELLNEYPMIVNYWFPAIPVFPDNHSPVLSPDIPVSVELTADKPEYKLFLGNKVTDADNMESAIVKSITQLPQNSSFNAIIRNDSLVLTLKKDAQKDQNIVTVQFNSNGKCVSKDIQVKTSENETGNESIEGNIHVYYDKQSDCIRINNMLEPVAVSIFDMQGKLIMTIPNNTSDNINISNLSKGIYAVKVFSGDKIFSYKFIK